MNKDNLIALAKEKGVEINPQKTKADIAAVILANANELDADQQEALNGIVKPAATSGKTAPILLRRDYWDEDGNRHRKDETIHEVPEKARELIKAGKAERADPMPGE